MKTLKNLMVIFLAIGSFSILSAKDMYVFQTTNVKIDDKKS